MLTCEDVIAGKYEAEKICYMSIYSKSFQGREHYLEFHEYEFDPIFEHEEEEKVDEEDWY